MAQASPTICAHNAPGQVLVPGRTVPCRQCGADLQPTPRAGTVASQNSVNACYPGDRSAASQAWAFAR